MEKFVEHSIPLHRSTPSQSEVVGSGLAGHWVTGSTGRKLGGWDGREGGRAIRDP